MSVEPGRSIVFVDARDLGPAETYRLLVGSVVPRPIAWVTSGIAPKPVNLAPFSSFAWVSQHPAMLGFTVNRRPDGSRKDTIRNIEADGEYVVHVADRSLLEALHASSEWMAPDASEAEAGGLAVTPSRIVAVPRLEAAPIAMECRYDRTISFSPTGGDFVVGTVVGWTIADSVMSGGRIASDLLGPVGRLAGPRYSVLGEIVELPPVRGG